MAEASIYLQLTDLLRQQSQSNSPPGVAEVRALTKQFGNELTADLLTAAALQKKATEKLGEGLWWVTDKALQQATPWQVAKLKAEWFADQQTYDLCCGIGGDTLQLARRGKVTGVDLDHKLVAMAEANFAEANLSNGDTACFQCDDVTGLSIRGQAIHLDPDRRAGGRRASRVQAYSPSWPEVSSLVCESAAAVIKLAPAAQPDYADWPLTHRTWISLSGSVREQTCIVGTARENFAARFGVDDPPTHSALIVDRSGLATHYAPVDLQGRPLVCDAPLEWMIDPDAAIRAAGLTESLAHQFGLSVIGGPAGFLTGDAEVLPDGLAIAAPVVWHGSSDDRNVRRQLRSRNLYPDRIKARGADVDTAKLQKRLRECGEQPATLWIGRGSKRQYAVITISS